MRILLLLAAAIFTMDASAQLPCGTETQYKKIVEKNPAAAITRQQLEDFTKSFSSDAQRSASTVKVIPVVFHIIHTYGAENISKAQVLDAVRILNLDFRKMNADTNQTIPAFKSIAADGQVEFRLASLDPNGNCTDGITRTYSQLTHSADDNVKELISWDNDRYLNIWVVNRISFGAGGYAYYPGTAPFGAEGVVVVYTQCGSIGASIGSNFSARTLTHEVGHYFNLPHTWGGNNDCGNSSACMDDDGVTDTPNTNGACLSCNLSQSACGPLANVQNYMDYSTCSNMFTAGQAQRMDAALNSSFGGRNNLWQPSNLASTGVSTQPAPPCTPVADFGSNTVSVCAGTSISFKDYSWNATITGWSWQFPGGTPSTSTDSMPVVQYNTPGTYNVTLTATGSAGSSTVTRTNHINVEPVIASYNNNPYTEGFETSTVPGTDWMVLNQDNGTTWQRTTNAAATGTASAFISSAGNSMAQVDELISPSINLSQIPSPAFTFRLAFAAWDTLDELEVLVSKDCGRSWAVRYHKSGSALVTAFSSQSSFVPNANQWRTETVSVAAFASYSNVMFKFRYTFGSGKGLYIDNINIASNAVSIAELDENYMMSLYPNPAGDHVTLDFTLPSAQTISLRICNMLGQTVWTQAAQQMQEGKNEISISTASLAPGIYMAEMMTGNGKLTKRLIIE